VAEQAVRTHHGIPCNAPSSTTRTCTSQTATAALDAPDTKARPPLLVVRLGLPRRRPPCRTTWRSRRALRRSPQRLPRCSAAQQAQAARRDRFRCRCRALPASWQRDQEVELSPYLRLLSRRAHAGVVGSNTNPPRRSAAATTRSSPTIPSLPLWLFVHFFTCANSHKRSQALQIDRT
jgi:hypothetical protein